LTVGRTEKANGQKGVVRGYRGLPYSRLKATIGSTFVARRAGTNAAKRAQAARVNAARQRIIGSWLLTPDTDLIGPSGDRVGCNAVKTDARQNEGKETEELCQSCN
jgi:hypothetical protein